MQLENAMGRNDNFCFTLRRGSDVPYDNVIGEEKFRGDHVGSDFCFVAVARYIYGMVVIGSEYPPMRPSAPGFLYSC